VTGGEDGISGTRVIARGSTAGSLCTRKMHRSQHLARPREEERHKMTSISKNLRQGLEVERPEPHCRRTRKLWRSPAQYLRTGLAEHGRTALVEDEVGLYHQAAKRTVNVALDMVSHISM
jgi:hypothetical protein